MIDDLYKFDLVDEMQWEDLVEFETLESAGLENQDFDNLGFSFFDVYFAGEM